MDVIGKLKILLGIIAYLAMFVTFAMVIYFTLQSITFTPSQFGNDFGPLRDGRGFRDAAGNIVPIDTSKCDCKDCLPLFDK